MPLTVRAWADDAPFSKRIGDLVKRALPALGTEIGLRYHRKLIDALKSGDKTLCENLMDAHLEETIQEVLKKTKQNPVAG